MPTGLPLRQMPVLVKRASHARLPVSAVDRIPQREDHFERHWERRLPAGRDDDAPAPAGIRPEPAAMFSAASRQCFQPLAGNVFSR